MSNTSRPSTITQLSTAIENGLKEDPSILLVQWSKLAQDLKKIKAREMELRKQLAKHYFPALKEGTNKAELGNGWGLKNKHTITYKCDEASFPAVFEQLPEGSEDRLIKYKPEVVIKEYRKLSLKDQKIFDEALTIKPGSPALELVKPKQV